MRMFDSLYHVYLIKTDSFPIMKGMKKILALYMFPRTSGRQNLGHKILMIDQITPQPPLSKFPKNIQYDIIEDINSKHLENNLLFT